VKRKPLKIRFPSTATLGRCAAQNSRTVNCIGNDDGAHASSFEQVGITSLGKRL